MISIMVISYFSKELIMILADNKDYYIAYYYVPIISLAFYIKGIHYNFSVGLHLVKKTKYNTFIVLFGAIVNLIFNYIFVPKYGIWGATAASIIASIVIMILYYRYSQKYFKVNFDLLRLSTLTATGIVFIIIGYYLNTFDLISSISLKLVSLVSFIVTLYYLNYFNKDEIAEINNLVTKARKIIIKK
jgi:O-antigen/teichoic acid export membrane protein